MDDNVIPKLSPRDDIDRDIERLKNKFIKNRTIASSNSKSNIFI